MPQIVRIVIAAGADGLQGRGRFESFQNVVLRIVTTLKDIGEELGLSVGTVSRALNGFPEVNARTRARVLGAAKRLNYHPNRSAQKLVTGRSGMVALVVRVKEDLTSDQTFFETLARLSSTLEERRFSLVLVVDTGHDPVAPYAKHLGMGTIDGFIVNGPSPDDPRIAYLRKRGVPFVLHGRAGSDPEPDYAFVTIDNRAVAREATQFLIDLGHRRIGLLNGEAEAAFAVDRRAGFEEAMGAAGLAVLQAAVAQGGMTESFGYTSALRMLSRPKGERPTALVCAATRQAAGVQRAARDLRLDMPGDLSIIAHDDVVPQLRASHLNPALTVTRAPLKDAYAPLATHLIALIDGTPARDLQTYLTAEFIVRDSTGPVPEGETDPWP